MFTINSFRLCGAQASRRPNGACPGRHFDRVPTTKPIVGAARQLLGMRWYARPENEPLPLRGTPRLASWEKSDRPDQVRLRKYLDDTEELLGDSRIAGPWALRLDVGRPSERDLLDMADVDNYVQPLAARLNDADLVSVWCTKQHSEQSFVRIEAAQAVEPPSGADVVLVTTTASWAAQSA